MEILAIFVRKTKAILGNGRKFWRSMSWSIAISSFIGGNNRNVPNIYFYLYLFVVFFLFLNDDNDDRESWNALTIEGMVLISMAIGKTVWILFYL